MNAVSGAPLIPGLEHVRRLGSGGYADVYLYEQRMPARRVAVKVMKAAALSSADAQRFAAEANAMALLEHPHIVPVYAAGATADGRPYLVMMYYPQASLAERAKRERFSVAEVLRIGIQISSAVETAHRAGLLHRDIKPANILTSQYGTPGLTDFGIASHMSEAADDDAGVSVPWSPVETLYASGPATVRSDVYSLAATLWHLLVGRSPFEEAGGDNSTYALMRRIRDVPPPSTGRSDVPASLDRLLRAALAKDPGVRPASALALARSLQAIEQELRLTRTEIILAAEDRTMRVADALPSPEETRLKPQQVIAAPAPGGSTVVRPPGAGERPRATGPVEGRIREATQLRSDLTSPRAVGGAPDDVTHLRARAALADSPDEAAPARPGRGIVMGAAALAIVAVAVGAFQVVGRGTPTVPEPGLTASVPPPELTRVVPDPGPATVTATRSGGQVAFAWTYDHALPDDQFLVVVDGGQPQPVGRPELTVDAADRACAAVRVMRADGSGYQAEYSQEACA